MSEFATPRAEVEHCLRMLGSGRLNFAGRLAELLMPEAPEMVALPVVEATPEQDLQADPAAVSGDAAVTKKPAAKPTKRRS